MFLAVLSWEWFERDFCRRELREYLARRSRHAGSGEGLMPVYFIEAPDQVEGWIDDPGIAADVTWCREQLLRAQARLEPWFPAGEAALSKDEVQARVGQIAARVMPPVQERLDRSRIAEAVAGNVRATTPTFIGRAAQLRALHEAASLTAPGTVALVHGPGGFGKTELAVAYANQFRAEYGAGVWQVAAQSPPAAPATAQAGGPSMGHATGLPKSQEERNSRLLAAIGSLSFDLGLALTDEERANRALALFTVRMIALMK